MIHTLHVCDERCVCPIHKLPMYYSRVERDHACQDPTCRYARGVVKVLAEATRQSSREEQP